MLQIYKQWSVNINFWKSIAQIIVSFLFRGFFCNFSIFFALHLKRMFYKCSNQICSFRVFFLHITTMLHMSRMKSLKWDYNKYNKSLERQYLFSDNTQDGHPQDSETARVSINVFICISICV